MSTGVPRIHETLKLYAHNRYTDEEIRTFNSIMNLERGFKGIATACAVDTDTFLLLITQVCGYMRVIFFTLDTFS